MRFRTIAMLLFLVAAFVLQTSCGIPGAIDRWLSPVDSERWDKTVAKEFLTISELKRKKPGAGIYETEGFVVDVMPECKCPLFTGCKCYPASVTISEQDQTPKSRELTTKELRVLVDPVGFTHGKKYRFKIEISDFDSDDKSLDDVLYVAHKVSESEGEDAGNVAAKFLTIHEIRETKPKPGIYETEGYVVDSVPECKCPPDSECDCPAASITISVRNQTPKSQKLNENELVIWVKPDGFERGRKYRFNVRIDGLDYEDDRLGEYFYVYYVNHKESESESDAAGKKAIEEFDCAMSEIQKNELAIRSLGEPIKDKDFVKPNIEISGSRRRINFNVPVSGPKGSGTMRVRSSRDGVNSDFSKDLYLDASHGDVTYQIKRGAYPCVTR